MDRADDVLERAKVLGDFSAITAVSNVIVLSDTEVVVVFFLLVFLLAIIASDKPKPPKWRGPRGPRGTHS